MRAPLLVFLAILLPACLLAQEGWQQRADYRIQVRLDDVTNILTGTERIRYYNNSPDTLEQIFIHLWANAFKDRNTPFAEEQLQSGNLEFHFADPEERGYIDLLAFDVEGQEATWEYLDPSKETVVINLENPLPPNQRVIIHTPFSLKLPSIFSRMGRQDRHYQVSQWYPKVALYDEQGWHLMNYQDIGEYYSNFGTYDVFITIPKNYVVAATGNLRSPGEKQWLLNRSVGSASSIASGKFDDFEPATSLELKTVYYHIDRAHDFAWFADKRFLVSHLTFAAPGQQDSITAWSFFTPEAIKEAEEFDTWVNAPEMLRRSVQFYSALVGPYPFRTVTAVSGHLGAGGGMEYPTITVIDQQHNPYRTILHEVGHNWFYGILASNEREHPWMDESINSYYEQRFFRKHDIDSVTNLPALGNDQDDFPFWLMQDPLFLGYLLQARRNLDPPMSEASEAFNAINYASVIYGKGPRVFQYLAEYLGQEEFDRIMQEYYREWQFRHPQPEDLQAVFEANTEKDLNWFFDGLIQTSGEVDYAIRGVKQEEDELLVRLRNDGGIASPVLLKVWNEDDQVDSLWVDGFTGKKEVSVPVGSWERVKINPYQTVPEVNFKDNSRWKGRLPLHIGLLYDSERVGMEKLLIGPALGYNTTDGFMLGLSFYNTLIPPQRIQYALAPMYAFGTGELTGLGEIRYNTYSDRGDMWKHLQLGLQAKSFNYEDEDYLVEPLGYTRIAPYLEMNLRRKPFREPKVHTFRLQTTYVQSESQGERLPGGEFNARENTDWYYNLGYEYNNRFVLGPSNLDLDLQLHEEFAKLTLEAQKEFVYNEKGKGLHFRLFGGKFLYNTGQSGLYSFNLSNGTGIYDYTYDQLYFDRYSTPYSSFWSQQIFLNDAGFKTPSSILTEDNWMLALNTRLDLPWVLPLQPYGSAALVDDYSGFGQDESPLFWEAGIAVVLVPDVAEVFFPLVNSSQIRDAVDLNTTSYWQQITWRLNFEKLNPLDAVKNLERMF